MEANKPSPQMLAATNSIGGINTAPVTVLPWQAKWFTSSPGGAVPYVMLAVDDVSGLGPTALLAASDAADSVLESATADKGVMITRLTAHDGVNQWVRVRALTDSTDAQATQPRGVIAALARLQGYNGATFDRLRTGSAANLSAAQAPANLMTTAPGEWAVVSVPVVSVQATVTRAAGGAGVRHVCRGITVSSAGPAAQTAVDVYLRDGAAGVGPIIWAATIAFAAGTRASIELAGLNIFGAANTAMTLEFAAAPVATNFQRVSLQGYDAA